MPRITAKEVLNRVQEIVHSNKEENRKEVSLPAAKLYETNPAGFLHEKHRKIPVREIDPSRCKPWKYHNRDTAWLTKERCADLISSIQKNGQNDPALVREVSGDPNYDFELIYGVRRWFACSQIPNQRLLARVTDADDKTCMILMHAENADSKDISEFERAFSFAQQMKSGVFSNQTEMAEAMGITQGLISRMIKAAELFEYEWIRNLFSNKLDIKVKPAYNLVMKLKDPSFEKNLIDVINGIERRINNGEKISSAEILKILLAADKPKKSEGRIEINKKVLLALEGRGSVYCKRDSFGKVIIIFDREARFTKKEVLLAAAEKAIDNYVLS